MDITIFPEKLRGQIAAVPCKAQAHRYFLCAALADAPTTVQIPSVCDDLAATIGCVGGLGARVEHRYGQSEVISPITALPERALCDCGESGATLRFLLPLAGALGVDTLFLLHGRLPYRPLSPLWEELERHGCRLRWVSRSQLQQQGIPLRRDITAGLRLTGKLRPGHYRLDGNISSQFISGLLMALPLLEGESRLEVVGKLESAPYVDMTLDVLAKFGVRWDDFTTAGRQKFLSPGTVTVEGDWSNAAFFLAADHMGSEVAVTGLNDHSVQGDKAIVLLLERLKDNATVCAADIPDLIPILAVVAAADRGAVFTDVKRLRYKESDRLAAIEEMLRALGGNVKTEDDRLIVLPAALRGGTVDACNDHRIAMAAAIASTVCEKSVTILGADCVSKSYPNFWKEFTRLGGKI